MKFIAILFLATVMQFGRLNAQPTDVAQLLEKTGCLECHGLDKNIIGPTFKEIATQNKPEEGVQDRMALSIKNGSKGRWTELSRGVPMPPYSNLLTEKEIQSIVNWINGL